MKEIKFVKEEVVEKPLQFQDVETNQFFTDGYGYLCQKATGGRTLNGVYVKIANGKGVPFCDVVRDVKPSEPIRAIHPKIVKIEF